MAKAMSSSASARGERASAHDLSTEQLLTIYRYMILQRYLDNRGFQLNRQGKIPFAAGAEGHEAAQQGAAMAFKRGADVLVPYYRDLGLALGVGMPPVELLLSMFARAADNSGGRQFPNHYTSHRLGIMSISSIIAAHIPHGVGAAFTMKYRNESSRAVLASFGEGSTSEGEWHESLNFAAVHKLPIVFFCQNNEWAISTPQTNQMAIKDVCIRAAGYGMPGAKCDGFDPIATYMMVKEAMERARSGGGPSLIEAKCYRYLSHTTDDDDRTYRSREEVEAHRKDDPLPRFEKYLMAQGLLDEAKAADIKKALLKETNDATDEAEALPYPEPADLYKHVYAGDYEPWQ